MRIATFGLLTAALLLVSATSSAQEAGQDDRIWVNFGSLPLPTDGDELVLDSYTVEDATGRVSSYALMSVDELETRLHELAGKLPRVLSFISSITGDFEVAQIELGVGIGARGEATIYFISGEYSTNAGIKLIFRRVGQQQP